MADSEQSYTPEAEEEEKFPYAEDDEGVSLEGSGGIAELLRSRRNVLIGAAGVCAVLLVLTVAIVFVLFITEPSEDAGAGNSSAPDTYDLVTAYSKAVEDIIAEAEAEKSFAFGRLTLLADSFPARLSGKPNLNLAIDWLRSLFEEDGLDNVRLQEAWVPVWQRNNESIQLLSPVSRPLPMLGLGGSIATPLEGIQGEVIVVQSFEELHELDASEVEGKIVLYNSEFVTYSETVKYRTQGAIEAAAMGAIASMTRSITPFSLQTPHTGVMYYSDSVPKIPHAAITLEDADYLQRKFDEGTPLEVSIYMEAAMLNDTLSHNVIGELVGTEFPEKIVVVGGHTDSWDVGTGAMDDGGGVIAAWHALRVLKKAGLKPRRTIRVIGWVNEENGGRGADAYRDSLTEEDIANHMLAIESDTGVFTPVAFTFAQLSGPQYEVLETIVGDLMKELGFGNMTVTQGGGGADTEPLQDAGIPVTELLSDNTRYFWYHHTVADTIDKLDEDEVSQCTAALAILTYVIADMEPDFNAL